MNYQLEIKQVVDYPRCRIYREFIRTLMEDKGIRTTGSSYLFYYMILCSFANFRSSYRRLEGVSYLVGPGEWICRPAELSEWFRTRYQHQALTILEHLQKQNYIAYTRLERSNLIKFSIIGWQKHNTASEYNYPCQKNSGFYFFPIAAVHELISMGKCSEMDIVLDLWVHAIYNDEQVQGSELGPVVYFRNCTGNPVTCCKDLALRWGLSKATVSRILNKLQEKDYLSLLSFNGRHGSVIYLRNYLSTMFNVCDVMIDKEEVSLVFHVTVSLSAEDTSPTSSDITEEQIIFSNTAAELCDSEAASCVSKPVIRQLLQKAAEILAAQGIFCCECTQTVYKLYSLSDCGVNIFKYSLSIACSGGGITHYFELSVSPENDTGTRE